MLDHQPEFPPSRIRAIRHALGLKQTEFAERLGISARHLWSLEAGVTSRGAVAEPSKGQVILLRQLAAEADELDEPIGAPKRGRRAAT